MQALSKRVRARQAAAAAAATPDRPQDTAKPDKKPDKKPADKPAQPRPAGAAGSITLPARSMKASASGRPQPARNPRSKRRK
jgi:hypothetical protein